MNRKTTGEVLLVGEGDFSLALSLTEQLNPECLTATCYLSEKEVVLHKQAINNIRQLRNKGATVLFSIDATKLIKYDHFHSQNWMRIIFNFPHVGGKSNIKKNRELLKNFFMSSVKLLSSKGQICVTLAQGQGGSPADQPMREWQNSWQIIAMAACANLILRETIPFVAAEYPLYSCTGFRSQDKHFNTDGAITHIFESGDPVVLPGTEKSETAHIVADDSIINCSKYFATKFNRKLYKVDGHPVCEIQKLILDDLKNRQNLEVGVVPSDTSTMMSPLSHHRTKCDKECYCIDTDPDNDTKVLCEAHMEVTTNGEDHYALRTSMLVIGKCTPCDNEVTVTSGDVYQKCRLKRQLPVKTEMVFIVRNTSNIELKDVLCSCVTELLSRLNKKGTINCSISDSPSNRDILLENCDRSITIGKLHTFQDKNIEFTCAILDINTLACVILDIPDHRLLWSNDSRTIEAFENALKHRNAFKSVSLYPLQWKHDISFWVDDEAAFDENVYSQIVFASSYDCIKEVKLSDSYRDESGRLSKTYSHIYQAPDRPLPYSISHQIQSSLRLTLAKFMKITLR